MRREEMTEEGQSAVGFSAERYCNLKRAPDPLWEQYNARKDVARTEMLGVSVDSTVLAQRILHIWGNHICVNLSNQL